jgi:hypothetical protein
VPSVFDFNMGTNLRISLAYLPSSGTCTHPLVFPLSPEGKRGNHFFYILIYNYLSSMHSPFFAKQRRGPGG